jgi:hypothetical protein
MGVVPNTKHTNPAAFGTGTARGKVPHWISTAASWNSYGHGGFSGCVVWYDWQTDVTFTILSLVALGGQRDAPRCAVVLDHSSYAVPVAAQLAHSLQQLALGAEPNPRCLREPFADAAVSPRERELLALEVQGLPQRAMAERLVVVEGTIRVYLTLLRERLASPAP